MLYLVELEKLEERYTKQWSKWFRDRLTESGIAFEVIYGDVLTNSVETGKVLDASSTNYFKFSQLQLICKLFINNAIHDNDKFFIYDIWFPGLESIPYMATLYNKKVDIYGFLHAGSYTEEDFASPMHEWARYFELGWYKLCKKIFVGSSYHKNKFLRKRLEGFIDEDKIVVTGNPFKSTEIENITKDTKKEKVVIFPNRFDHEKRPEWFLRLARDLRDYDIKFIITTSRKKLTSDIKLLEELEYSKLVNKNIIVKEGLTKEEYYKELGKSKIFYSPTIEENFGYCLVEAMSAGCIPIVRKGFSHNEILQYNDELMFETYEESVEKVLYNIELDNNYCHYARVFDRSIDRIIDEIIR